MASLPLPEFTTTSPRPVASAPIQAAAMPARSPAARRAIEARGTSSRVPATTVTTLTAVWGSPVTSHAPPTTKG